MGLDSQRYVFCVALIAFPQHERVQKPIGGVWHRQRLIMASRQRGGRTKDTSVHEEQRGERREKRARADSKSGEGESARDCKRLWETGEIRLDRCRMEDEERYKIHCK